VITPPAAPAPPIFFAPIAAPVPIAPPAAAPAPIFVPAPIVAPAPVVEEKKEVVKVVETVTAKVTLPAVLTVETQTAPAEMTTQKREPNAVAPVADVVVEKVLTKVAVSKVPVFTGKGPFKFTLGLTDQESSMAIKDPDLAMGLKVISQTPAVCRVAATFSAATGKYSITVVGIANGQCRISAIDKGNDEKFPTATEIKQMIKGIATKNTVNAKTVKPTPTPKPGVKNTSYTPPRG
jgi:hypothetical protein